MARDLDFYPIEDAIATIQNHSGILEDNSPTSFYQSQSRLMSASDNIEAARRYSYAIDRKRNNNQALLHVRRAVGDLSHVAGLIGKARPNSISHQEALAAVTRAIQHHQNLVTQVARRSSNV